MSRATEAAEKERAGPVAAHDAKTAGLFRAALKGPPDTYKGRPEGLH